MKVVILHGAPAVGKLTVAKALADATSAKLFDNHTAIDIAKTVFDFGAPGFWDLVQTTRVSVLKAAARQEIPIVIMTYCYSDPEDRVDFEQFCKAVEQYGGEIHPVFIYCSVDEAIRRVGNEDRKLRGKITTEKGLLTFNSRHNLVPVPHERCIRLDSETASVKALCDSIISHFSLREN